MSGREPRAAIATAVVATLALAGTVTVLVVPEERLAASNTKVIASAIAIPLRKGSARCQSSEFIPAGSRRIRLYADPLNAPGPAIDLTIRDRARVLVSRTRVPPGYGRGPVYAPIVVTNDIALGQLCIRVPGARIFLAGNLTSDNAQAPPARPTPGTRDTDEVRADYLLDGERSWMSMIGRVGERFETFSPSWGGWWLLIAAGVLVGVIWAAAVRLVLREVERP